MDRRFEWVILVLGLAGVVAIFVPFAHAISPWQAMPVFLKSLVDRSEQFSADWWFVSVVMTSLLLPLFIAPVITLVQLSRCVVGRVSAVERAILVLALILVVMGYAGFWGSTVFLAAGDGIQFTGATDVLALIGAPLIPIALFITARSASLRRRGVRAEICALTAYIGSVATLALLYFRQLDPTAAVAGLGSVVYTVSLWRRVRA